MQYDPSVLLRSSAFKQAHDTDNEQNRAEIPSDLAEQLKFGLKLCGVCWLNGTWIWLCVDWADADEEKNGRLKIASSQK